MRLRDEDPDFALPLLEHLLREGPMIRVTWAAADSLYALPDRRGRPALVGALDHPNDWVRLEAAARLAGDKDPRARPVLLAAFDTDDIDQFETAVPALCKYEDDEARRSLEHAVGDPDAIPFLRENAANGLRVIGTSDSLPALRSALVGGNGSSRAAARATIETIEAVQAILDADA